MKLRCRFHSRMSANYCSKITVHLSLWRDLEPDARYRGALFQFRTRVRRRPGCTGTLLLPFFFSKLFERNALRTQFVRWGRSSSDRRSSALRTWPPQSRLVYMCVCVCCALCVVCMYYRDIHYLPSCTRLASLQISVYFSWAESKTGAPPPEEPKSRSPHQSNVPLSRQRSHSRARTNMGALAPPHFYAASSSCRRPTRSALFPPTLSPRLRSSFLSLATVNVV